MPIATPEVYAQMLDDAKQHGFAYPSPLPRKPILKQPERDAIPSSPTAKTTKKQRRSRMRRRGKSRSNGYQRILLPLWTRSQNRTTVGVRNTRQHSLYHDCPVWPCTHALYPCIRRPPPRKHQRLPA